MLKIKEDKMQELEKFGFEPITIWGDDGYAYDFRPYTKTEFSYLVIHCASREVIFDKIDIPDIEKCCSLLFDLIKADMVEKVGE